jgi:hypothetical protein
MTDKQIVKNYLESVRDVHLSGAGGPETSYYPPLANLFKAIGTSRVERTG